MSGFVSILPYLEQSTMYNGWNMMILFDNQVVAGYNLQVAPFSTIVTSSLAVHLCPSDTTQKHFSTSVTGITNMGTTSYAFNAGPAGPPNGTDPAWANVDIKVKNLGFAHYQNPHGMNEFTDGTSNTLAVGETLANDGLYMGLPNCPPPNTTQSLISNGIYNLWSMNGRFTTTFRTTKNPLNTKPCLGTFLNGYQNGAFGSTHAGGGNFLFADGSVHFIKSTINLYTYQSLSTRGLGEVVSADSF